jgi:hypothetical protein
MVVADFDLVCVAVYESKTNAPLVIDRNSVLALSIVPKSMQSISRRYPEIVKLGGEIYVFQFPRSSLRDISRKALGSAFQEQIPGATVGECLDQTKMYRVT